MKLFKKLILVCSAIVLLVKPSLQADQRTVVIDSGSWLIKAGFAGERLPSFVDRNVVSHDGDRDYICGEALGVRGQFELSYPYNFGFHSDPYGSSDVWTHVFRSTLQIDPTTVSVVMTESPVTSPEVTIAAVKTMERLGVKEVTVEETAVMTLRASGLRTGLVVESGFHATFITPIIDMVPIDVATQYLDLGSEDVNLYMQNILGHPTDDMMNLNQTEEFGAQYLKECYVALDVTQQTPSEQVIMSPEDEPIVVGTAFYMGPEILFQPYLNNLPGPGFSEAIYTAIQLVHPAYHPFLYGNIVLGGGNTVYPGLAERLVYDLQPLTEHEVSVVEMKNREYSAWIGASME